MSPAAAPRLDAALAKTLHHIDHRALWRIGHFAVLYLAAASAAMALYSALGGSWWAIFFCLPFYLLAGASLHGISLFTHEGVHGVLSPDAGLNRAISVACGLPVGQTFTAYRVLHLRHHQHLGALGDPDHYPNYTEWTPMIWAMHWGRLIIGYPIYLVAIPLLGFTAGTTRDRLWIALELGMLVGLIAAVITAPLPANLVVHGWLMPMLMVNCMVNIRGMSQHTLLEHATDVVHGTRSLLTHKLVAFFMCNENYHLEHHLYPGVPWHQLPTLHQALGDELKQRGAPYLPSYSAFVWAFIRAPLSRRTLGTINIASVNSRAGRRP